MFCYEVVAPGDRWPILYDTEAEAAAKAEAFTRIDPWGRTWVARWTWVEEA